MADVMSIITAIRNIRGEMRIGPGVMLDVTLRPGRGHQARARAHTPFIEALARCRLTVDPRAKRTAGTGLAVVGSSEIYVTLAGVVDLAAERTRLEKELARAAEQITFLKNKLARPEFVERAPAEVVAKERDRLAEQRQLTAKLEASLASIGDGQR
jgi:valyl-tRNA synthetase